MRRAWLRPTSTPTSPEQPRLAHPQSRVGGLRVSSSVWSPPPGSVRGSPGGSLRTKAIAPGAIILRNAGLAPGSGTISESIYPFGVEAVEALSYGLRVAAEFLGYFGSAQPQPTQKEMIRALKIRSPRAWRLPASLRILRTSSVFSGTRALSDFGMGSSPFPRSAVRLRAYVYRL
jgi:hypothetical protein